MPERRPVRASVDEQVLRRYPDYMAVVVALTGWPTDPQTRAANGS